MTVRQRVRAWSAFPALRWAILVYVTAGLAYLALAYIGGRGDCAPRDRDGQCGMSTLFGHLYGAVAAGTILVLYHVGQFRRRARVQRDGHPADRRRPAP